MYRFSLIVTAVGLLLAGSASATPRTEFRRAPQDGFWGGAVTVSKEKIGAIRAFANSRLTSRA
jgi:hypothetical protein